MEQIRAIGREPQLLDQVVRAIEREQAERRPDLEAKLRDAQTEREQLERKQKALLSTVAEAKAGRKAIVVELGELAVALEAKEGGEAALRAELDALEGQAVDPEALRRSIEEFDGVWDDLFPRERARLLRLLVARVAYHPSARRVDLGLRGS